MRATSASLSRFELSLICFLLSKPLNKPVDCDFGRGPPPLPFNDVPHATHRACSAGCSRAQAGQLTLEPSEPEEEAPDLLGAKSDVRLFIK
jgi:hypothetical protein